MKLLFKILIVTSFFGILFTACEDSTSSDVPVVGRTTRAAWSAKVGFPGYEAYKPDSATVAEIIKELASKPETRFKLYASSWCGTCVNSVPKIFKVLDAVSYNDSLLTFVAIDYSKRDPEGLAAADRITAVLTFIVVSNGVETGRITEFYASTWENEILKLLNKNNR